MSRLKSEVKVGTLHEMGVKLDDLLEAAEREQGQYEGGKSALVHATKKVEQHLANVDRDVQEGKLTLEQAALVKRWVTQCVHILSNLAIQAEVQAYMAQGKVMCAKQGVAIVKGLFDKEKAQLDATISAETVVPTPTPSTEARLSGQHPGNPIADRRAEAPSQPVLGPKVSHAKTVEPVKASPRYPPVVVPARHKK